MAKTLLEMAGIKQPHIKWSNSILIIVDAQKEYREGFLPLSNIQDSLNIIQSLLSKARLKKAPIIHIHHHGSEIGPFSPSSENSKSLPEVSPISGETVVIKNFANSFTQTNLKDVLDNLGKDKNLLITGYMSHNCISSTARGASDMGYTSVIISDAVGTRDLQGVNGETIDAETVNTVSIAGLKDRISWVIKSESLLSL